VYACVWSNQPGDLILHLDELDQLLMSSVVSTVGKYVQVSSSSPASSQQHPRSPLSLFPLVGSSRLLAVKKQTAVSLQRLTCALLLFVSWIVITLITAMSPLSCHHLRLWLVSV